MGDGTGGRASGEDILAVEDDVIPLVTEDPGDFPRLPVDDARQDHVQAAAG